MVAFAERTAGLVPAVFFCGAANGESGVMQALLFTTEATEEHRGGTEESKYGAFAATFNAGTKRMHLPFLCATSVLLCVPWFKTSIGIEGLPASLGAAG
jgi:hypothetical protein